jgi:uncharacterized protein DUF262
VATNESSPKIEYEPDAAGQSAGVELEHITEDDQTITEPFDPRLIDVTTETRSLDTLIKRLEARLIDLDPDFQRLRGIWNANKKSQLIESLLLRIPLPTFYVAEVEADGEFGEDSWAVVDGIQRLSTIAEFVSPATLGLSPLRLTGLEYLDREKGKTFDDLSQALRLRVLESQFTIQVIRKTTPEPVKLNIFARINTGGMALSAQELRNALTPGPARQVLRSLAESDDFQTAVDHSIKPSRMADREMVLRFLAFRMTSAMSYKTQDFDSFLRGAMARINAWDKDDATLLRGQFHDAMAASVGIFGNDAFRKRYSANDARRPVSKALFEAVAVAIASVATERGDDGLMHLIEQREKVLAGFMEIMGDPEFDRSISQGTGDPVRVRYRFGRVRELMFHHA